MNPIMDSCCGIDVHKDMIEACIVDEFFHPKKLQKQFQTTPSALQEFVLWLQENECRYVAMESTGVYWRPVYEAIETFFGDQCSIFVANAHEVKNVPGRKSDVKDAEWIATLMQHGLLKPSFVPERLIRDLREYSRSYKNAQSEKSRCINRMEKFLQTHGFKLSEVLSDITSKSGIRILTLLAEKGSLTLEDVEKAKSSNTKHTATEIQTAICGKLNANECFLLDDFLEQFQTISRHIEKLLAKMKSMVEPYQDFIAQMDSIVGIDITASLLILAEIGGNPQDNFQNAGSLCAWAGLVPRNDKSNNVMKSRKIMPGNQYLKSILCQCARVAVRSRKNSFSVWYWSHRSKLGDKKAIIAVSRKMLALIYYLHVNNTLYDRDLALNNLKI